MTGCARNYESNGMHKKLKVSELRILFPIIYFFLSEALSGHPLPLLFFNACLMKNKSPVRPYKIYNIINADGYTLHNFISITLYS